MKELKNIPQMSLDEMELIIDKQIREVSIEDTDPTNKEFMRKLSKAQSIEKLSNIKLKKASLELLAIQIGAQRGVASMRIAAGEMGNKKLSA